MTLEQFLLSRYRLEGDVVVGPSGVVTGTHVGNGYWGTGVRFDGKWRRVLLHRLVYLLHHGHLPEQIDHANGDKSDNRIENLRAANARLNQANRRGYGRSGFKGVCMRTKRYAKARFEAVCDGQYLGIFDTAEEAAAAYDAAAREKFGAFARTNG